MAQNEQSAERRRPSTHLLFFRYVVNGPYTQGEEERRGRATQLVQDMGGTCEIFRIAWNGFDMVSIVKGLSPHQMNELAAAINGWGAVQATLVETSGLVLRR